MKITIRLKETLVRLQIGIFLVKEMIRRRKKSKIGAAATHNPMKSIPAFRHIILSTIRFSMVLALLATAHLYAQRGKKRPDWMEKKPVDAVNYIGIGSAPVNADAGKMQEAAKQNALANMSSDIITGISATTEVTTTEVQKTGQKTDTKDEFSQKVQALTDNMLEGYEMVDSYNDGQLLSVYYRLNKNTYITNKRKRFNDAIAASDNSYTQAVSNEQSGEVYQSFLLYTQAIEPLVPWLLTVLEPEFKGKCTEQANKISAKLTNLMSRTSITAINPGPEYKFGQRTDLPLEAKVQYKNEQGQMVNIGKFPVKFAFTAGKGQLLNEFANSDETGLARGIVRGIEPSKGATVVIAEFNTADFKILEDKRVTQYTIGNTAKPKAIFRIKTAGVSVNITTEEGLLGNAINPKIFEPMLKDFLTSKGCTLVKPGDPADFTVTVKADTRQGIQDKGAFTAFMNGSITATKNETGEDVAVLPINELKGIGFESYDQASRDCYKKARERMNKDFLPAFLKRLYE